MSGKNLMEALRRWLKRKPDGEDPYTRIRVPVRKGPSNRSAAVALKEPNK